MHKSLLLQSEKEKTIKYLEIKISSKDPSLKEMRDTESKNIELQTELEKLKEKTVSY